MSLTTHFNCKPIEKHDVSRYLILARITDTKINGGSGIRMSWVDFSKTLINGGTYIWDSRVQ